MSPSIYVQIHVGLGGDEVDLHIFNTTEGWTVGKGVQIQPVRDAQGQPALEFHLPAGKSGQVH